MKMTYKGFTMEGTSEELAKFCEAIERVRAHAKQEEEKQKEWTDMLDKAIGTKILPKVPYKGVGPYFGTAPLEKMMEWQDWQAKTHPGAGALWFFQKPIKDSDDDE